MGRFKAEASYRARACTHGTEDVHQYAVGSASGSVGFGLSRKGKQCANQQPTRADRSPNRRVLRKCKRKISAWPDECGHPSHMNEKGLGSLSVFNV